MRHEYSKNSPNWQPSPSDYLLVFRVVDGVWREISGNMPEYANMTFAEYISAVGVSLPDDCIFCRIRREGFHWEMRESGGLIRVFYKSI